MRLEVRVAAWWPRVPRNSAVFVACLRQHPPFGGSETLKTHEVVIFASMIIYKRKPRQFWRAFFYPWQPHRQAPSGAVCSCPQVGHFSSSISAIDNGWVNDWFI